MYPIKKVVLLTNLAAGKGKALRVSREVSALLHHYRIPFTFFSNSWPETLDKHECSDVFLIGGDGTLNYFLNKYPGLDIPVTLFKGGSGNDFAWKLYRDISVKELFERILEGHPKTIDLGTCNGLRFINGAGIGFDGAVVKSMGAKRFVSAGYFAYLWTVLKNIALFRERECRIRTNSQEYRGKYFMISIANGERYGGGFIVAPGADIEDGYLDLVMIREIAPLQRLKYLPRLSKGSHVELPFVQRCRTNEVWISGDRILAGHRDGELVEAKDFHIKVIPAGIKMRY